MNPGCVSKRIRRTLEAGNGVAAFQDLGRAQVGERAFARADAGAKAGHPCSHELVELLLPAGCNLLYLPSVTTIYPEGHSTFVEVAGISSGFEGDQRPGHFQGVATVVTCLLNLVQPDVAVFGEKDAQQLAIVRRLVRDLHLPVEIEALATVREADGLALSSRNAYLSPEDRCAATVLYRSLQAAKEAIAGGERSADVIRRLLQEVLEAEPRLKVDYADIVDTESFQPIEYLEGRVVIPIAGRLGATRLLDNLHLDMEDLP